MSEAVIHSAMFIQTYVALVKQWIALKRDTVTLLSGCCVGHVNMPFSSPAPSEKWVCSEGTALVSKELEIQVLSCHLILKDKALA